MALKQGDEHGGHWHVSMDFIISLGIKVSTVVWSLLEECPFQMLLKHALCVQEAMVHLSLLFEHRKNKDEKAAAAALESVSSHEHQADLIKRNIRKLLNEKIFIPVSRRDLLDVLLLQDSVANEIEDISGLFFARDMNVLDVWDDVWGEFVSTMTRSVALMVQLNEDLSHIIEAGFQSRMQKVMMETVSNLDDCEHEHDEILKDMRKKLYAIEDSMKTIDIWFYYQLLDRMGNVTDLARRLGFQLNTLVTR